MSSAEADIDPGWSESSTKSNSCLTAIYKQSGSSESLGHVASNTFAYDDEP